jgi:hypothetical protein
MHTRNVNDRVFVDVLVLNDRLQGRTSTSTSGLSATAVPVRTRSVNIPPAHH